MGNKKRKYLKEKKRGNEEGSARKETSFIHLYSNRPNNPPPAFVAKTKVFSMSSENRHNYC